MQADVVKRFFVHELSKDCDWCSGTGVGSDESGRCYGCSSSGKLYWDEDRPEPSARDAEFFSSISAAMTRAEELGVATHAALVPWGSEPYESISWARKVSTGSSVFIPYPCWSIQDTLKQLLGSTAPRDEDLSKQLLQQSAAFETAKQRALRVPEKLTNSNMRIAPAVAGRSFAELQNPFLPMLQIAELGFSLVETGKQLRFWAKRAP